MRATAAATQTSPQRAIASTLGVGLATTNRRRSSVPNGTRDLQGPPRVAIYLRQSKDKGGDELAVDRQNTACRNLCKTRGWKVTGTYTDNDVSATNGKTRPQYTELLAAVRRGEVDVIVAWELDRLSRTPLEVEELLALWETTGLVVSTVSGDLDLSTDAGRLVGRILVSVARGEVERKSRRQKAQALQAAEAGRVPFRRS